MIKTSTTKIFRSIRLGPKTETVSPAASTGGKSVKVYFENLNAIRFIAAFMVIIHHVEQFKYILGVPGEGSKVIGTLGKLGVVLFFVLSGFLISYLLFKEKEVTKTISIKDFYIRRILRIWPLYFLIVLTALFVFPFADFMTMPGLGKDVVWSSLGYKLLLFVFFLPNLVLSIYGIVPFASQTWSIGAEEQFYLMWPVLNKWINRKWTLMFGIMFGYMAIKYAGIYAFPKSNATTFFNGYWESTPIDCMAIGGLFALIVYEKSSLASKLKSILFNRWVQLAVLAITIASIGKGIYIYYYLYYEYYAILFGILIMNFACNPKRLFSLEYGWLNYLGKISYGLYMYHTIAIVCSIRFLQKLDLFNNYYLYPVSIAFAIIISSVSYEFFEKRFIRRKHKYSKVISGENAR
jgi:peptidoglycan/LPS O-acetylase OafA/YrhL